jgi:putative flippase GtrA
VAALVKRLLQIDFVRFCIVGASGFVINAVLLLLLKKDIHSTFVAQLIAGEVALFSNFLFHHNWTYKASKARKAMSKLIVQFHMTSWIAIVASAALVTIGVHSFHMKPVVALAGSSALSLFWNFGWSKFVIWRGHDKSLKAEDLVAKAHTPQYTDSNKGVS